MTAYVVDPWAARKQAQFRAAMARVSPMHGIGQSVPAPSPQAVNLVGWGAVALLTVGIYWTMTKGMATERNPSTRSEARGRRVNVGTYKPEGIMFFATGEMIPWDSFRLVRLRDGSTVRRGKLRLTSTMLPFHAMGGLGVLRKSDAGRTLVVDFVSGTSSIVDYLTENRHKGTAAKRNPAVSTWVDPLKLRNGDFVQVYGIGKRKVVSTERGGVYVDHNGRLLWVPGRQLVKKPVHVRRARHLRGLERRLDKFIEQGRDEEARALLHRSHVTRGVKLYGERY